MRAVLTTLLLASALVSHGLPATAQSEADLAELLGRAYQLGGRTAFTEALVAQGWGTPTFFPTSGTISYQDVPPDAFTVFGSATRRPGGEVLVVGGWDFRNDYVNGTDPDNVSSLATESDCYQIIETQHFASDYQGEDNSHLTFLTSGGVEGTSVVGIRDRTQGFRLLTDNGVHLSRLRPLAGCESRELRAEYRYEHNQDGGSVVSISASLGALSISYDGAPSVLQLATQPFEVGGALVQRLSGDARAETAAAVSRAAFPVSASTVVVATGESFADALAGAPLAAALDAPILLVSTNSVPEATKDELQRLDPARTVILGGVAAVSESVEAFLQGDVERISGPTRFDTAVRIAERLDANTIYVVNGRTGWPDAVSASALAGSQGGAILLSERDSLPDVTASALTPTRVTEAIVVGGLQAVSMSVEQEVAARVPTARVAGGDRYETAAQLREIGWAQGLDQSTVWLVTGRDWPDSLAAGAVTGARGLTLFTTDGRSATRPFADIARYVRDRPGQLAEIVIVGGEAAISTEVEGRIIAELD